MYVLKYMYIVFDFVVQIKFIVHITLSFIELAKNPFQMSWSPLIAIFQ